MQKISVKTIYLILVISIGLVGLGVGSTFAMFTASSKIDNPISFTAGIFGESDVIETVEVTVPAGETKATNLHVTNSTNSNLNYVMWYIDEGLDIELGSKRTDSGTYQTTIDAGEEHQYEVSIRNNSSSSVTVVIGVSSGTGSVTLSSDMKMVPQSELKPTLASVITNLYISNTKTKVTNNSIEYNYATSVNLMNDRLGGTTSSLDGGNIRYYGASPNNYVYFNCESYPSTNCELWRIVGVFDGRVKLIRNESIGYYPWDTSDSTINDGGGANEWSQADLMKLLNPGYESESFGGSLYYNNESGVCYSGEYNATKSCDFTSTGIKNYTTRNFIENVKWNLGGWYNNEEYSDALYKKERGTEVITNPSDGILRSTSWTGKVALLYPSDYGYAANLNECANAGKFDCSNWLNSTFDGKYLWLLTPSINNSDEGFDNMENNAWTVVPDGLDSGQDVFNVYDVFPTLLKVVVMVRKVIHTSWLHSLVIV